jgi:hypothetical protein
MKKMLLAALVIGLFTGCNSETTTEGIVTAVNGTNGTSCSVAPEFSTGESSEQIGARVSCTDGSYVVLLNGQQGIQGVPGVPGQNGLDGQDAKACQAYRIPFTGAFLKCPGQWPVLIADGKDGEDGRDGASCSSEREDKKYRVKITCSRGHQVVSTSYVYDGQTGPIGATGAAGKSCTATSVNGGVNVKCGNDAAVFLAHGANGIDGKNGQDAITPGISCNVHNLANWDGVTNILTVLSASAPVGNFTLANLSVGNSQSSNGFPGMPAALQNQVGLTGYALDCNGYLNIKTSGMYTFSMLSDDGVRLVIDNNVLINSPQLQAPTVNSSKSVELQRGQRSFNVIYYQGPHTQIALELKYQGPHTSLQVIPLTKFTN